MVVVDGLEKVDVAQQQRAVGGGTAELRLQLGQRGAAVGQAGELVGHGQAAHGHAGAAVPPDQHAQHHQQHGGQADRHRQQPPGQALLRERVFGGFLGLLQQGHFAVTCGGVVLDLQGGKAFVELACEQLFDGVLEARLLLEGAPPIVLLGQRGRERAVGRRLLGQGVGAAEHLQRAAQRRHALGQAVKHAQGDASLQQDLRMQARIGHAELVVRGLVEQGQGGLRLAARVLHAGQAAQRVGHATGVVEFAAELVHVVEGELGGVPVAQALQRAAEVVLRHRLLAPQAGDGLCLERRLVVVARLRMVAHAVVEDGDGVLDRQRVQRQLHALIERTRTLQVDQPVGELAAHAAQVAALVQAVGQQLVVFHLLGQLHLLFVRGQRAGVVTGAFVQLAFAAVEARFQPLALEQGHQGAALGDVLVGDRQVSLGLVVAQQQVGTHLQVSVGLLCQQLQRLLGQGAAALGVDLDLGLALLDQRARVGQGVARRVRERTGQQEQGQEDL